MALSAVSQPFPEMEHLLLTKNLICFLFFVSSICIVLLWGIVSLRSDIGHGLGLNSSV